MDEKTIDKLIQLFSNTTDDALYAYFAYLGLSTLNNLLIIGALVTGVVYIARLVYKAHVPAEREPWPEKSLRAAYEATRVAWLNEYDAHTSNTPLYRAYCELGEALKKKGERV